MHNEEQLVSQVKMADNAAHNLLNRTLSTGWFVKEKLKKGDNQTGAFFSVGYLVEKAGETCFLKAFDIMKFNNISSSTSMMDVMNEMSTAYKYERDLSEFCKNKHVTKVSFVKEAGEENVPGFTFSIVPYLIFDLADGDVRAQLDFSEELDYAWRFKSLHDVAVGLKQLHQIEVSHQDLKPSNILVFDSDSKIGDLGRSMCRSIEGPYNRLPFTGDWSYAPPELMYGYFEKDWSKRVFATDCYLLGSLVVFYFAGISMTALLRQKLPDNFSWEKWTGTYDELVPYLNKAFADAIDEFAGNIRNDLKTEMCNLVEQLCNPFPEKRGHPKCISGSGNNYNMERFVANLDLLMRKEEVRIKKM